MLDEQNELSNQSLDVAAPSSPRVWTVFVAVILAVVLAIVLQAILTIGVVGQYLADGVKPDELAAKITEDFASPPMLLLILCLGQLGFGIVGFLCVWRSPTAWRQRIAWARPRRSPSVYPLAMLGTIFPTVIGLGAASLLTEYLPSDPTFEKFFDQLTIPIAVVFVVLIGVLPGIFEEVLFRGYMQQRLVQRWGEVKGIAVTSVVFALVHIMPMNVIAVLPIGLWFGYIAWRSQSIFPTILAHFFINSGINLWRTIVKFGEVPDSTQSLVHIAFALIGLICFAICVRPSYWQDERIAESSLS